ncbi:PAS domain S-box protein [Asticcacaulis sp. BYS171W]|uniref:histidine kinase n=1 Tax=Asticcacaulis aquaticus TaxID=2984212 RepID=A0ABT5HTQ4_9CAUL|nr:PAS domain S-box protein [Asticcacaulis aquaticus]MDC7683364.1 PAS domain S-box protein [Asticcacaulis aquaticus]
MLLESEGDLVIVLGVLAALLLAVAIGAGILVVFRTMQIRQFQDLLFKAERKIDHLERRMFNVLNAVPVALVETDATGKFIFANKAAHQLLGRKDNELIGLRFHSATWGITYPDGRMIPPDLLPIARTLRGQTVKGFQHLISNHGSQTKTLVSVTSMPIMNTVGEVIGSTTALVELETQTGEGIGDISGVWRGQWFAAAPVPFWGLDQNGTVLDVNPKVGTVFDTPREQTVGQNWVKAFVADADFQKAIDYLSDLPSAGHPASINLGLKDGKGMVKPVILTAWAVTTQDGGAEGLTLMAVPTEVTLSVSAPVALPVAAPVSSDTLDALADLQSAERARAALGVGVWQYDAASDSIVEDEGMRRLIGREYDGGPTLISDADQARADDAFGRLMSGETDVLDLELSVRQPDGSVRFVTLKGQGKGANGHRELFGVAIDVTHAKTLVELPAAGVDDTRALETQVATLEHDLKMARADLATMAALEGELEDLKTARQDLEALKAEKAGAEFAENPELVTLKAQLDELKAAETELLNRAQDEIEALKAEVTALKTVPEPDPVVGIAPEVVDALNAEIESLKAENAALSGLTTELETLKSEKAEVEAQFALLLETPLPVPEPVAEPTPERTLNDIAGDLSDLTRVWKPDGTLVRLSRGWNVLTGCSAQEFLEDGWLDNVHEDDQARVHEALKDRLEAKTGGELSYRVRAADGSFVPVLERLTPVTTDGAFDGLLGVGFDLTAHLPAPVVTEPVEESYTDKLEYLTMKARTGALELEIAQLQHAKGELERQALALDEALAKAQQFETVGRLTGDVAADFSQMLNVMNAALDMIGKSSDSPDLRRLSEAALAAGKRGERLTRQLLAFTTQAKEKA